MELAGVWRRDAATLTRRRHRFNSCVNSSGASTTCAWMRAADVTIGIIISTTRASERRPRTAEMGASAMPACFPAEITGIARLELRRHYVFCWTLTVTSAVVSISGRVDLRSGGWTALPRPSEGGDGCRANRAAAQPPRRTRARSGRRQQLAVRVHRVGLPRLLPPLRSGYPTADERERLRAAQRASLRVVNFAAVHAQAGVVQLHHP